VEITTNPRRAAEAIAAGHLAALPTETVYGLGANADDHAAIARVYAAKGRPGDHPLIVHVAHANALGAWVTEIPEFAQRLADRFWPGPLTLVLPRSTRAQDFITGGQDSVAIRVPAHPMALAVLRELIEITNDATVGIAAPSANRFGHVSPTTAEHVIEELSGYLTVDDVILDGGPCEVGVESTIIDCTGRAPVILRPGFISQQNVEETTGLSVSLHSQVRASGTLESHYSPRAHVVLVNATELQQEFTNKSGFIAPDLITTPAGLIRLASPANVEDYASILYSSLRAADAQSLDTVYVVPPSGDGLAVAIRDRLTRAAHH
jgi:L-threonylcarbamoyladenylate synthase